MADGYREQYGELLPMLANGGWLTWTIWRAPTNASKWRMGFNSAFKWLTVVVKTFKNIRCDIMIQIYKEQYCKFYLLSRANCLSTTHVIKNIKFNRCYNKHFLSYTIDYIVLFYV